MTKILKEHEVPEKAVRIMDDLASGKIDMQALVDNCIEVHRLCAEKGLMDMVCEGENPSRPMVEQLAGWILVAAKLYAEVEELKKERAFAV